MEFSYTVEVIYLLALDRADLARTNPTTGDIEGVDSVSPTGAGLYINAELAALWDILINAYEDYCIKREYIDVVSGIEDYSMPSDFYKFRKIFPIINGQRATRLRRFELNRLGEADSLSAILTSPIEETRYKVTGNRMFLHPMPSNPAQLELWYVPQFDPVVNLDDKIDFRFPFGWEQYVVEGVAAKLLEKEDIDATAMRTEQAKILKRILIMSEDRDVGEPHTMQDTEGYLEDYDYRRGY